MKRRDFLIGSVSLSSLILYSASAKVRSKAVVKSNSKFLIGHNENTSNSLLITNSNGEHSLIKTPCKAHEVTVNPKQKNAAFGSGKWEKYAFLVDINKSSLLVSVEAPEFESFYGHSLFSSDGQFLFSSMMDDNKQQGFISVRETRTLKEVRRFLTNGRQPHQLRWAIQDKKIAVINSTPLLNDPNGAHSVLSFINVQNGELVKSFNTSIARHSHFSLTKDIDAAIICRVAFPHDSTLYEKMNLSNGEITVAKEDAPLLNDKAESLSHVLIEEKSLAIMTIVALNRVVIWDYKNNKVVFKKDFTDKPRGIVMEEGGKNIFISFDNGTESYINMYTTEKILNFDLTPYASFKGGTGSHLTIV